MKGKARAETPFRIEEANNLYIKMAKDSHVWEYGIDTNGKIYFAYLNGLVKRYTRREFIKMSRA